MKAKCIKDLTIDGYRFEEGLEYDFEWHLFTHDADERDSVLARGCKVMYIQYAVKYKFNLILPKMYGEMKFEEVPATLYLYDRQYCEHEDYTAPPIYPRGWTSGGPLLCFDDFFEEVYDDATLQILFNPDTIGMAAQKPNWPSGTKVVVYARKEDREKALIKTSRKGYVIEKFVEVSGLQAKLMGEGMCIVVMSDQLRQEPVQWEPSPYSVVKAWQDRFQYNVIYPLSDIIGDMKCLYPTWRGQMLGGTRLSDWPSQDKTKEK